MNPSKVPNFTCPLDEFVKMFLTGFDKLEISEVYALVIKELDPNELYCHIELPTDDNKLKAPILWRPSAWRQDEERLRRLKEKSIKERRVYNVTHENAQKICSKLMKETGLEYELVWPTALKIARKQKLDNIEKALNQQLERI